MENLVDNLVKKPLQTIIGHLSGCRKRKRSELGKAEPKLNSFFKASKARSNKSSLAHQNNLQITSITQDIWSPLRSRPKKVKLSISEAYFLNERKKIPDIKNAHICFTVSQTKEGPFIENSGYTKEKRELELEDTKANHFKLSKAQNQETAEEENIQNQLLPPLNGHFMEKKANIRAGDEANPVVVGSDNEEEEIKENSIDDTNLLLHNFDKATKNISHIAFDYLGSPILDEKEFEEKLSLVSIIKDENMVVEEKKADEEYYKEIGDIWLEKTMDQRRNYPLITQKQYQEVKKVWNKKGDLTASVVTHGHIRELLTYKNLKTLSGLSWLNDEVVNAYLTLLNQRDNQVLTNKIFIFNTFFYPRTLEDCVKSRNFEKAYRVTKRAKLESSKVSISDCLKVFVPLNLNNNHWAFVHIDLQNKIIEYHDSMGHQKAAAETILKNIQEYIVEALKQEEREDKQMMNGHQDYKLRFDTLFPQQNNCSDCGVFMLKGIDFMTQNLTPNFSPEDMPYFRILITYELILGKLLTPN